MAATTQEALAQQLVSLTEDQRRSVIFFLTDLNAYERYVNVGTVTTLQLNGGNIQLTKGATKFAVNLANP